MSSENIPLMDNIVIQELQPGGTYTYLGMIEGGGVEHHGMKKSGEGIQEVTQTGADVRA